MSLFATPPQTQLQVDFGFPSHILGRLDSYSTYCLGHVTLLLPLVPFFLCPSFVRSSLLTCSPMQASCHFLLDFMLMEMDSSWAFELGSSWACWVHFLHLTGLTEGVKELEIPLWEWDEPGAGQRQSSTGQHTIYKDPALWCLCGWHRLQSTVQFQDTLMLL